MLVMLEQTNHTANYGKARRYVTVSKASMLEQTNHTANYGKARRYVTVSHVRAD